MKKYREIVIEDDTIHLHKIAVSGQCFRWKALNEHQFFVIAGEKAACLTQIDGGIKLFCSREDENYFKNYLDFGTDYKKIANNISKNDEYLCEAAKAGKGIRILRQDLWETMVSFIISQRNNIPRITHTIDAMCEALGDKVLVNFQGKEIIGYGFPKPERLEAEDLSPFKLGYRQSYIEEAAKAVVSGQIDLVALEKMSVEQTHKALCQIKGIGVKVASCIQLFGLHQLSVFPVDTWIKKVEERHYGGRFPVEKYADYAGVIQQYLFYYERLNEGKGIL